MIRNEIYKERFKLLIPLYGNTKISKKTENHEIICSYDAAVQLMFGQNY